MKKDSWVLVANSSVAYIYKIEKKNSLIEIASLEHPESRLHNRDLSSDKPGRDFESGPGQTRHSLEPHHTPKQNEYMAFAREIANHLNLARSKGEFEKLYLAANPSFLGLLRNELDESTKKLVSGEVDKDMTQMKTNEIVAHFPFLF